MSATSSDTQGQILDSLGLVLDEVHILKTDLRILAAQNDAVLIRVCSIYKFGGTILILILLIAIYFCRAWSSVPVRTEL